MLDELDRELERRGHRFVRYAELRRLGVGRDLAAQTAGSPHGVWHLSRSTALSYAMPGKFWRSLGLPAITKP